MLVGYGSATWDVFPVAMTRGVARIDLKKVRPWSGPTRRASTCSKSPASSAALIREVNAITNLFEVTVLLNEPVALRHQQTGAGPTSDDAVAESLAELGGDERLEALVQISALPLRPIWTVPELWEWFRAGIEDLRWLAEARDAGEWEQQAAVSELDRRAARDIELLSPRRRLRRTTTG